MSVETRKQREKEFHNKAFGEHTRRAAARFYRITRTSNAFYQSLLENSCQEKKVLEYGCGPGTYAFSLAREGSEVTGIDISEVAIQQAQERAKNEGVENRTRFFVMDAEATDFPDNFFDTICGEGILHHLDVDRSFQEVQRMLKPGGKAIFLEPLGHNPFVNLYRALTPHMRTQDEHPLVRRDLLVAERYFGNVRMEYFHLLTLFSFPFLRTPFFSPVLRVLEILDKNVLKTIQPLRAFAWIVALELSEPKKDASLA